MMRKKYIVAVSLLVLGIIMGLSMEPVSKVKAAQDEVVIMIDPGHDGTHSGAYENGLREEVCNMKIALACKAELDRYAGVQAYLTHTSLECAFPGTNKHCLYARTDYAEEMGASLIISLHNNTGYDTSGFEIYYPNDNYIPSFHGIGEDIAESIATELRNIGLHQIGLYTKNSYGDGLDGGDDYEKTWYPNGERADYYAIIRNAKYNGVVGMIVEHAYLSNDEDAKLLADDEMLKCMGEADARGLANYYGFVRKDSINGLYCEGENLWKYYENAAFMDDYVGFVENENGWWYVNHGVVDFSYTGLAANENGWWFVNGGKIDYDYSGVVANENGWWYVNHGCVDFSYTGVAANENGWWRIVDGRVDFDYTGVAANENGWWRIVDGRVDFSYTGLAANENGWWYINGGRVDFGYYGVVANENGWWCVRSGSVDFDYTGVAANENGWWRIEKGYVDFTYHGLAANENGWWYLVNGRVDFDYTGMAENEKGNWCVIGGKVHFDYTGLAYLNEEWFYLVGGREEEQYIGLVTNDLGMWYVNKGKVDFAYNNESYIFDNQKYQIVNGFAQVTEISEQHL